MKDRKYQVFVSSTFSDLVDERQQAVEAILDSGNIPAGMELFKGGKSQKETIRKWIEDSDIYMLILGGRYGSLDDETEKSYTEWEYDLAIELGKPLFAIVLSEDYINQRISPSESEMGNDKYKLFKQKVIDENKGGKIVGFIKEHKAEITNEILRNISELENSRKSDMVGWVKASFLEEHEELKKKYQTQLETNIVDKDKINVLEKEKLSFENDYISGIEYHSLVSRLKSLDVENIDQLQVDVLNFLGAECGRLYVQIEERDRIKSLISFPYDDSLITEETSISAIQDDVKMLERITSEKNVIELFKLYWELMLSEQFIAYEDSTQQFFEKSFINELARYSLVKKQDIRGMPSYTEYTLTEDGKRFMIRYNEE